MIITDTRLKAILLSGAALGSLAMPAAAETVTVITSFPKELTAAYKKAFKAQPGVWGTFTYDSANILFAAMTKSKSTDYAAVMKKLLATKGFAGQTGTITARVEIVPAPGSAFSAFSSGAARKASRVSTPSHCGMTRSSRTASRSATTRGS